MDSLMQNYKKDAELENEMDTIDLGNYVKYDEHGHSTFKKCPHCGGPTLGHIQVKCPKVHYDEQAVKDFEFYLESLGGYKECWDNGYKKYKKKFLIQGEDRNQRVQQLRSQRQVPE